MKFFIVLLAMVISVPVIADVVKIADDGKAVELRGQDASLEIFEIISDAYTKEKKISGRTTFREDLYNREGDGFLSYTNNDLYAKRWVREEIYQLIKFPINQVVIKNSERTLIISGAAAKLLKDAMLLISNSSTSTHGIIKCQNMFCTIKY